MQRSALQCLLQHGDPDSQAVALAAVRDLVGNRSPSGEQGRVEAAHLMGELARPEFPRYLSQLVGEDLSFPVIRAAMDAAGKKRYPGLVPDLLLRLC